MATITTHLGRLSDGQTGTGASTNVLALDEHCTAIAFQIKLATTGTVAIEYSADGTNFTGITGYPAVTASAALFIADPPAGLYRANITANGSGVTIDYRKGVGALG